MVSRADEKLAILASDVFGLPPEKFSVRVEGEEAEIELPPLAYSRRDSTIRKIRILSRVMKVLPFIRRVRFIETYDIPGEGPERARE